MARLRFWGRVLPMFWATSNPATQPFAILDGTPVMGAADQYGVQWVHIFTGGAGGIASGVPNTRTAFSAPAAGVVASATLAADGSGALAKNVAQSIQWTYGDTAAAAVKTLVLRDGASGVGAIIWSQTIGPFLAGTSNQGSIVFPGGIPGPTAGNAMCLEFTAAPAGTGVQSVAIEGYYAK